jgi:hypothetical protein
MSNNYNPLDETYFQTTDAPLPAGLLKEVYDNLRQVDLNQRKYQLLRAWNVGRTSIVPTDNDACNEGDVVPPIDLQGYTLTGGTFADNSTRGFQIIPCDPRGTVLTIPFFKSSTSNLIEVNLTYQLENSPMYMSSGYVMNPEIPEATIENYPISAISGETFISTDFYNDVAANIRELSPINDPPIVFAPVPGNTRKQLATTGVASLVGLATFRMSVPLASQGAGSIMLSMSPTWNTLTLDTERVPVLYQDSVGRFDYNAIRDTVKDDTVSYAELMDLNNTTGGKVPYGIHLYNPTTGESYYHHVIMVTPGRNTLTWDEDEVTWIVYPDLDQRVVDVPSDYRYDVHIASKITIFGISIRELYVES